MSNTNYAGFWLRFVAIIIDGIIVGAISSFVIVPLLGALGLGVASMDPSSMNEDDAMALIGMLTGAMGAIQIVNIVIYWLYFALMESSPRQATIGKMALGLKVTDADGNRIDFLKASIRYVGKIISSMILMIGYLMAAFTEKKQALHDIIANTLVVKK